MRVNISQVYTKLYKYLHLYVLKNKFKNNIK